MKYYSRQVTKRETINKFGRKGFKLYLEYLKTNDISQFNHKKKIKFSETTDKTIIKELRKLSVNTVYEKELKTVSKTW